MLMHQPRRSGPSVYLGKPKRLSISSSRLSWRKGKNKIDKTELAMWPQTVELTVDPKVQDALHALSTPVVQAWT